MVWRISLACVVAGLLLIAVPKTVRADELSRLNALILHDTTNIRLNLEYAREAERVGEYKWALVGYERILVNDPTNEEARSGLERVRRKLQPDITQFILEFGTAWESNPFYMPTGARGEWELFGRLLIRDERRLGDVRWRTVTTAVGEVHRDNGDLNYGYFGMMTGPVLDLPKSDIALHPAIGGGVSYFAQHPYYSEGIASVTFEGFLEGAFQSVRVRGAFRDYNDFFPSTQGFYGDVTGKFARANVLAESDVIILSPWARLSGIGGAGININFEEVQVGRYFEYGTSIGYYRRVLEWLTLAADFIVYQRLYAAQMSLVDGTELRRRDLMLSPGVIVILHNLFREQADFRFDYHYQHNDSNDPTRLFINHLFTAASVVRF